MSSTNRGATRSPNDFYVTNPDEIVRFMRHWCKTDSDANGFWSSPKKILDPSAGGLTEEIFIPPSEDKIIKHLAQKKDPTYELSPEFQAWKADHGLTFKPCEMSYPKAIKDGCATWHDILTQDIRENSKAQCRGLDFLNPVGNEAFAVDSFDMVITNPPFSLAIEFIRKALLVVKPGGYVVMLLRLNFFGSEDRNRFFLDGKMPQWAYVHSKRLGFTPDGKTDSIEYMHAIFRKTDEPCYETRLRVLPY